MRPTGVNHALTRCDRRTYERLVAEINAREEAALAAFSAETDALVARLARRYGPLPGE